MARAAQHAGDDPGSGSHSRGDQPRDTKAVLEQAEVSRALTRIAHEIIERTRGAQDIVLLGIPTRGVPLAARLAARIGQVEGQATPHGSLDITMYRDDLRLRPARSLGSRRSFASRRTTAGSTTPSCAAWALGSAAPGHLRSFCGV